MAGETAPVLNGTVWWSLRQQFSRTLPKFVSETYLATVLSLKEGPARNVLRNLKLLGLVDEENRPTDLAIRWRDDEQYAAACEEIAERAYPDELRAAVPRPNPDPTAAAQWFQRSRRLGDGGAKNAARTYVLIASAELHDEAGTRAIRTPGTRTSSEGSGRKTARPSKTRSRSSTTRPGDREQRANAGGFEMPRPQIAVQINIAPNMTAKADRPSLCKHGKAFLQRSGCRLSRRS